MLLYVRVIGKSEKDFSRNQRVGLVPESHRGLFEKTNDGTQLQTADALIPRVA